jgi:hypothetical protein
MACTIGPLSASTNYLREHALVLELGTDLIQGPVGQHGLELLALAVVLNQHLGSSRARLFPLVSAPGLELLVHS